MHIGIDLTALLPQPTGVDVSLMGLTFALAEADRENQYTIFANFEDCSSRFNFLPPNFKVFPICWRPRPIRLLVQQLLIPLLTFALRIDVLHSPSFIMPILRGRPRHVLTIHDMTPLSHPEWHIPIRASVVFQRVMAACIRRADIVTVPSNYVKQTIFEHIPDLSIDGVHVVPWGINTEFHPYQRREIKAALKELNLANQYVLSVGTVEPRKNLTGLLRAYKLLIDLYNVSEDLVIAGTAGWGIGDLEREMSDSQLSKRVHYLGYVSKELLPRLYAGASLFVYPSFEEGFGFPPLEAMACGTPTIASESSSLSENLGDAAKLVPPNDSTALAAAMNELLKHQDLRSQYRQLGLERARHFSWDETAQLTLKSYLRVAAR